jgi:4-hydroxy-tetrahydrodipicolinate synthase
MSLVVGCSAIQPSQVVTYCKQAREYEAMSALIVTPYYVKPPQRGLLHFYKHVADEGTRYDLV